MSKELEALNLIRENLTNKTFRFDLVGCLDTIEEALITKSKKELAFDIVVKKECDMRWLEYCIRENKTVEEYNNGLPEYYEKLTEEEFKLLKEVLE